MQSTKIPATIITGFLGSGKTTLLRHVLDGAEGLRIAVIVNEFGELGIDGDILRQCSIGCEDDGAERDGQLYELSNGCLCCTVQEEFFPVMQQLVERRGSIDHILIETSGLALPKPLVQAFNWPTIKNACTVDAVVTVVDAPAVATGEFAANPSAVDRQRLADPNVDHVSPLHELFEDQLSAADLVVLNKTDLIGEHQCRAVERLVSEEIPNEVKIVRAKHGQLDLNLLLGLNRAAEDVIHLRSDHHSQHVNADGEHDHDVFDSVVVELPPLERQHLLGALHALLERHTIYRVKGFAAIPGKPMRLVVHGVGRRFDSHFDRHWGEGETPRSVLVLIGRELEQNVLQESLAAACVAAAG